MDLVLRATFIYLFLMVLFAIAGKRSLAQVDTFDLVLLLIISEATQQALLGEDFSLATAATVIATLVGLEMLMAFVNRRWPRFERGLRGGPVIVVEHGKLLEDRLAKEQLTADEVMAAARLRHGLVRLEQIDYAIVETSGEISIIPR